MLVLVIIPIDFPGFSSITSRIFERGADVEIIFGI